MAKDLTGPTISERRPASGNAFGSFAGLSDAPKEPRDALRLGDHGDECHASVARRAAENLEPKGALQELSPWAIPAALAQRLGGVGGARAGAALLDILLLRDDASP
jgi:hypothetical protein